MGSYELPRVNSQEEFDMYILKERDLEKIRKNEEMKGLNYL